MFNRLTGRGNDKHQDAHQEQTQEPQEGPTGSGQVEGHEDQGTDQGEAKKAAPEAIRLPFVYALEYPYRMGERTIREIRCDRRPTMRTMKRLAAAGENDGELLEIIFEDLFDLSPPEMDRLDIVDGFKALEAIKRLFPQLGEGS